MKEVTLIYPHQLYDPHPALAKDHLHILIEDPHFFGDPANPVKFHKQKLMLHRASMRYYAREVLEKKGFQVLYLSHKECADFFTLLERLRREGTTTINVVDPTDFSQRIGRCVSMNFIFFSARV